MVKRSRDEHQDSEEIEGARGSRGEVIKGGGDQGVRVCTSHNEVPQALHTHGQLSPRDQVRGMPCSKVPPPPSKRSAEPKTVLRISFNAEYFSTPSHTIHISSQSMCASQR